jgi:Transcriptional regulator
VSANKNDRRVKRTKRVLCEKLSELILEKELHKITVRELTTRADIHRATFYAHYSDIYDLYKQIENEVIEEMNKILVFDPSHTYEELIYMLIDYIYENSSMFRAFFSEKGNNGLYNRISSFIEDRYLEIWKYETKQQKPNEECLFFIRYHIQGFQSVIKRWAENNYAYPKEKLIDIALKLDTNFDLFVY